MALSAMKAGETRRNRGRRPSPPGEIDLVLIPETERNRIFPDITASRPATASSGGGTGAQCLIAISTTFNKPP